MQIKELYIKNFRSLKEVTIPGLTSAVVFHGANNSGKSNTLLALETIFSAKTTEAELDLPRDVSGFASSAPHRKTPFWNGIIRGFGDSFYMGTHKDIEFVVRVEIGPSHFREFSDAKLIEKLHKPGHDFQVKIAGRIRRSGADGEMVLDTVQLNNKSVFSRKGENLEWVPFVDASVESSRRQRLGEDILNYFTDSVFVIPANRYLTNEEKQDNVPSLKSSSYKSWLHYQSLSREGFEIFKGVQQQLGSKPFSYGDISFVRDGESVDIMVDDGCGYRMPISQKGTGVQQILILLGFISASRARVIGIEEPEINLSFKSQDELITTLLNLTAQGKSRVSQILLASHSDHVGSRSELRQIHVENPGGKGTRVRRFTANDRAALFPRSARFKRSTML